MTKITIPEPAVKSIEYEFEDDEILANAVMPQRAVLLREAEELTCGDRNKSYGEPVENHQNIADIFNSASGHSLSAHDIAILQICVKLSRVRTSPGKADHYIDIMAYSGIAFECYDAGSGNN